MADLLLFLLFLQDTFIVPWYALLVVGALEYFNFVRRGEIKLFPIFCSLSIVMFTGWGGVAWIASFIAVREVTLLHLYIANLKRILEDVKKQNANASFMNENQLSLLKEVSKLLQHVKEEQYEDAISFQTAIRTNRDISRLYFQGLKDILEPPAQGESP